MKIIAVMNQKGGVGKTTTTVNLAASLVFNKKRVLLVDADLQGNATASLGLHPNKYGDIVCDLFAILTNQCSFKQALQHRPVSYLKKQGVLDVIPATIALSGFDQLVRALPNKQILLKQMLHDLHDYDYVLIDCPPSLGVLTINSLVAANEILIPVQTEFFGLQGLSQILDTVYLLQGSLNPHLKISGILCTRYNRRRIHQEVATCLHDKFGKIIFSTKISENIALAEAPSHGKTIFEYDSRSVGAHDYDVLCKEFLNREFYIANLNVMHKNLGQKIAQ